METPDLDGEVRASAFAHIRGILLKTGLDVVRSNDLTSFTFDGRSVPLVQQRGIVKVSWLEAALTIRTVFTSNPADRPYDDHDGADGYPRYKWQGRDPDAYDNTALRVAMDAAKPLIWFRGIEKGWYLPVFPVWAVGEEPRLHQFVLAVDDTMQANWPSIGPELEHPADSALRREYALSVVKKRVHQRVFRERVLAAYARRCALCNLRHTELLDAAHIKEDSEGGEPVVPNGVAMCALHHRAFDNNVIGIRPDYIVETNRSILLEQDGPTLRHAIQGVHGQELVLPARRTARPDQMLLEERYERFKVAS